MRQWMSRHSCTAQVVNAWLWMVMLFACTTVHAHLMVAQRGTLNLVGDGAYMVMSLPTTAFKNIDDDGDGRLSYAESHAHRREIETQIRAGVQLAGPQGQAALEGVMFSLSPPDDAPTEPAQQLVVLGRFALAPGETKWQFKLDLFGSRADEQTQHVTVTRGEESQLMTFTPARRTLEVLPSGWTVFVDQLTLGAEHILTGADHVLFLLVVLATGWRLRNMVVALTCFTAGHAATLITCNVLGWKAPAALVEPAIAATIVGMAGFDRWCVHRGHTPPAAVRWVGVFGCALIHGLGLAQAFSDLGLNGSRKVLSLAGFNLGIELGQLAVAVAAVTAVQAMRYLFGNASIKLDNAWVSYGAMALGMVWFFERLLVSA